MPTLPVIAPQPPRHDFRFALPPSLGLAEAQERAVPLERFLGHALGKLAQVSVATSYESLAKDLLSGKIDAAWAPPFVCARVEAMGIRVLVRGVRKGASSYRAALVCRAGNKITLEKLAGTSAVWADRDSVAGFLLPMALLRSKGMDPGKTFFAQQFAGNYRDALELVLAGKADVTSVFAPPARAGVPESTGADELVPDRKGELAVIAFTDESPNDGVAVAMGANPGTVTALEKMLLTMQGSPDGEKLLKETFNADRFEPAPRMGYRALYRVALASI